MVASAVSAACVLGNLGHLLIPVFFLAGQEIPDAEFFHITLDKSARSHNAGAASSLAGKGVHREGSRDVILEDDIGDIVVGLVVVAVEYATGEAIVFGIFQPGEEMLGILVSVKVENAGVLFPFAIDGDGVVGAGVPVGAAVRTVGGSAFGGIFFLEIVQVTIGDDALAGLVDNPTQDVQVVAGLGQNNGRGVFGAMPVAAYIGVGHMSVLDALHMLDADNVADDTALGGFTEGDEVRGVAKYVAYGYDAAFFLGQIADGLAFFFGGSHRFFQEEVVTHVEGHHSGLVVQVVRRRNNDGIGEFFLGGEHIAEVGKAHFGGDAVFVAHIVSAFLLHIGHTHDFHSLREFLGVAGIDGTPVAASDDNDGNRMVRFGRKVTYGLKSGQRFCTGFCSGCCGLGRLCGRQRHSTSGRYQQSARFEKVTTFQFVNCLSFNFWGSGHRSRRLCRRGLWLFPKDICCSTYWAARFRCPAGSTRRDG